MCVKTRKTRTFVLLSPLRIVQLCVSKACCQPQPVEPFDHRGVWLNENTVKLWAPATDDLKGRNLRYTQAAITEMRLRAVTSGEEWGGTCARTSAFQEKLPVTDSFVRRRWSSLSCVLVLLRLCSHGIREQKQVLFPSFAFKHDLFAWFLQEITKKNC